MVTRAGGLVTHYCRKDTVELLDQRAEPGSTLVEGQHDEQVRWGEDQVGVAHQRPAPERAWVGEVEALRQCVAEGAERVPGERGDPGVERERAATEAWAIGAAVLGVAAGGGVDPQVVHADPVALLVVLAGAVLVQQVEGRRGVVVEDEERVPAVLSLQRALTDDDGAQGTGQALDGGGGLGDLDLLELGAAESTRLFVMGEAVARQLLPGGHVARAARGADQEHGLAEAIEAAEALVGGGAAGVDDQAELADADTARQLADESDGEVNELGVAAGDDEREEAPRVGPVQIGELLGAHLLVADGVEALGDLELAREAGDDVLVDAQGHHLVAQRRESLGGPRELLDSGGLHGAHQPAEARAGHDLLAAGEDREARIVQSLEVEDALDAKGRAKEQREHEATRLDGAAQSLAERALRDGRERERRRQEEEGAPEVGAPDQVGRESSPSPAA